MRKAQWLIWCSFTRGSAIWGPQWWK